jgi:toxin ParE1/3/4
VARVAFTASADADSAKIIADLTAAAGANVADRYDADFDKLYERLSDHPKSGAPRPALGRYVRICVVLPYIVIYEHIEADDTVTIMRIAHGRRKITRQFVRGR